MAWFWKTDGTPLQKGDYIFQYVTAARWNELALFLLENGNIDEIKYNELLVQQGDLITADKFNMMAAECGSAAIVKKDDLITAKVFNDLVANL